MFNKDITIINKYIDISDKKAKYKISYVKGFLNIKSGVSINETRLVKEDELQARILISEKTKNEKQTYQEPKEFKVNQNGWTLQNDDYLVKGIVENFTTITKLLEDYEEVMKIQKVSKKDYGSKDMWHFVITGA